jgi:hypothetical protein
MVGDKYGVAVFWEGRVYESSGCRQRVLEEVFCRILSSR